jgi:hypothetical protein
MLSGLQTSKLSRTGCFGQVVGTTFAMTLAVDLQATLPIKVPSKRKTQAWAALM